MRKWEDALNDHRNKILMSGIKFEQILGIFLYGSQNYGIATEKSDIDTKAIIVPTLIELCLEQPISKELHLENGEHCEVKDIRLMVDMFKKQNINFLEILFTNYKWINPKYAKYWKLFIDNAEEIAHYNENKCIKSISGQALHTLHQFSEEDPPLVKGKKYANALRMKLFFEKYIIEKLPYKNCIELKGIEKDIIFSYKTGKIKPSITDVENLMRIFTYYMNYEDCQEENIKTKDMLKLFIMMVITNNNPTYQFYAEDD
jgi:predicted nucleotidyltransferase